MNKMNKHDRIKFEQAIWRKCMRRHTWLVEFERSSI